MARTALALIALTLAAVARPACAQVAGPSPKEAAVNDASAAYQAALQDAGEAMKKFQGHVADLDATSLDAQSLAGNITSSIEKRFADETQEAEKNFEKRMSDLKEANASSLDEKAGAALEAAGEVKHVGERKAHAAHELVAKMQKESKERVRNEGSEVKKVALRAKKAARAIEKAKKHAWGEKGEKEAEHEFSRNEKLTESMEGDAEHLRDQAEGKVEKYSDRVESDVEKWADGVERRAAGQAADMRRSALEAKAAVVAALQAEEAKEAKEAAEAAKKTEEKTEKKAEPEKNETAKQSKAPEDDKETSSEKEDDKTPAGDVAQTAQADGVSSSAAAVADTEAAPVDDASASAVSSDDASSPAAEADGESAAPVNGASIPTASPAQVFLAQLAFVVAGASVVGLVPNLRRGSASRREPMLLG